MYRAHAIRTFNCKCPRATLCCLSLSCSSGTVQSQQTRSFKSLHTTCGVSVATNAVGARAFAPFTPRKDRARATSRKFRFRQKLVMSPCLQRIVVRGLVTNNRKIRPFSQHCHISLGSFSLVSFRPLFCCFFRFRFLFCVVVVFFRGKDRKSQKQNRCAMVVGSVDTRRSADSFGKRSIR